jgi:hypothetical protein
MKLDLINPSKSPFSKGRLLIFPLLEKGGAGGGFRADSDVPPAVDEM